MKISLLVLVFVSLAAPAVPSPMALDSGSRSASPPSRQAPAAPSEADAPADLAVFPQGVVIEEVRKGLGGDMAGLQPGDVLLAWSLPGSDSSPAGPEEHPIRSPFDLTEVSLAEVPRGPVRLRGLRAGCPLDLVAPTEGYGLWVEVRPVLPQPLLDLYDRGRALLKEGNLGEGSALWRELAAAAGATKGGDAARCWLLGRLASVLARTDIDSSRGTYREAIACADKLDAASAAVILESQGWSERETGHLREAADAVTAALRARREAGSTAVARATSVLNLAILLTILGDVDGAMSIDRETVSALESEAPTSLALVALLTHMGNTLNDRGEMDAAQQTLARAGDLARLAAPPEGPTLIGVLSAQALIATAQGDLATAERLMRRSLGISQRLGPGSLSTAIDQLNLGAMAVDRGDFAAGEAWYRSALSILGDADAARGPRALLWNNLGEIARAKGDLATAEELSRRSVAELEALAPGSQTLATAMLLLAETLSDRGDHRRAKEVVEKALLLTEQHFPQGQSMASALTTRADVAIAEGDWSVAEESYARARVIRERLTPASARLAHVLHGLGIVRRARGQLEEARSLFASAIEALEAQRSRVGGSDEARSLFSSRFFGLYQDQIELLVRQGRTSQAFDVLERSRARSLLTLMAERDLVIEDEVPPQLERDRRRADAEYERTRTELGQLNAQKDAEEIERLTFRLRELREKQNEIGDKIREASPGLADLRDPRPLDAQGVQAALDPGTAFLVYSVGKDKTVLFVLTSAGAGTEATGGVQAITIPIGEAQLRERVDRWRRLAERTVPPAEFLTEARALYDLLVRPAEQRLRSARRLLISPDAALHRLPFAALRRRGMFLAQWMPFSLVPSGTIYAQTVRSRDSVAYATDVVAFGDPRTPGLDALPASRHEVEAIAHLFPKPAAYLGKEATEARAKAIGKGVRYVHFAGHGLIDERLPLDSALALSGSSTPGEGRDSGRLYAWEIIERVRLDAELVTLSACRSAVGTELAGEGLIGLTRAFQYAGAHSVLASLWAVGDKSTFRLMSGVYGLLKNGLPKDEALRRAQVQAIRRGDHPVRWAAFQLYGDWR